MQEAWERILLSMLVTWKRASPSFFAGRFPPPQKIIPKGSILQAYMDQQGYRKKIRRHVNRNLRGLDRLELWLVSAITTILAVRMFLELTGYPQVGGSSFHIAHVLWGGLVMAVGAIIMFIFLGNRLALLGTFMSGIGFGLFIDEVGKFVTKDNDYFYKPSVAIMYTVFIILYMVTRWVITSAAYTENEYLVNSISELQNIPIGHATTGEKKLILYLLANSDAGNPLAADLKGVVNRIDTTLAEKVSLVVRWRNGFYNWYRRLTGKSWFTKAVAGFFVLQFAGTLSLVLVILFDPGSMVDQMKDFTFSDWAILASNVISAVYICWGLLLLHRSRLNAYGMFERSVLVQLFLGQMFLFEKDELEAMPNFVFTLLLLLAIRFVVQREKNELISAEIASVEPMD